MRKNRMIGIVCLGLVAAVYAVMSTQNHAPQRVAPQSAGNDIPAPVKLVPGPMVVDDVSPTTHQSDAPQPESGSGHADLPTVPPSKKNTPAKRSSVQQAAVAEGDQTVPIARQALVYVGSDPAAEAVWVQSINDPSISAHDRQDLIEDLNEQGFDDPKHLTQDDLPLIDSRLALIEDLAPSSMDDVNSAAFAEAYKDLVNMHMRLVRQ